MISVVPMALEAQDYGHYPRVKTTGLKYRSCLWHRSSEGTTDNVAMEFILLQLERKIAIWKSRVPTEGLGLNSERTINNQNAEPKSLE